MRTRESQSRPSFPALSRLIVLVGLIYVGGPSVQAGFIVQAKGLQTQARPGTLLHGRIRLLNALFNEPQEAQLKVIDVEIMPTDYRQWRLVDSTAPMDPNNLKNRPKTHSCRKWISLAQSEITVESVDVVTIPVDIRIPEDLSGLYCAAIVVSVPPPRSHYGVVLGYDLIVPVLVGVTKPSGLPPFESVLEDYTAEVHPGSISVKQGWKAYDPYRTYAGSRRTRFDATFRGQLAITAAGISPTGGIWRASIDPNEAIRNSEIEIRVTGEDVRIDRLVDGQTNPTVACVTVKVIPDLSSGFLFWQDVD